MWFKNFVPNANKTLWQYKLSSGGTVVKWHTAKKLKKTRKVVEVTGIGHNRRFKVKWSDGMRTEETARGLAISGSAKANEGGRKRKRRDGSKPGAIECEGNANTHEESEEEDKGGR